jgi:hypothetical protein
VASNPVNESLIKLAKNEYLDIRDLIAVSPSGIQLRLWWPSSLRATTPAAVRVLVVSAVTLRGPGPIARIPLIVPAVLKPVTAIP